MKRNTPSKQYLGSLAVKSLCIAMGIGAAAAVSGFLDPVLRWGDISPKPQVEFTKAQGASEVTQEKPAALPPSTSESVMRMPVEFETPKTANAATPETPLPSPDNRNKAPATELAPLNPQEVDVVPATVGVYPEKRGGNILVVQLTIDENLVVVDSEIKVPSFDGLADISTALGAIGQRVKTQYPPMRKGELRKVDFRLELEDPIEKYRKRIEQMRREEAGIPEPKVFVPPDEVLP